MSTHRIFAMPFAKVYPAYVQKAERKGRTQEEVDQIIRWMSAYTTAILQYGRRLHVAQADRGRSLDRRAYSAEFYEAATSDSGAGDR